MFEKYMDGPISLSLMEYNYGVKHIKKVITIVDEDIDGLYYSKKPINLHNTQGGKECKG